MQLLANGKQQWIDANGAPLANGTVGYYVPATLTPKTTYQDQGGTIPNANPIALDSRGQAIVWGTGTYRQIVKDASGVTIWDQVVADTAPDIQSGALLWLTSVAGADTITANATPAITAYAAGQTFRFVSAGVNISNAVTLNINGLGAKNVTKFGTAVLSKGDIPFGAIVQVVYDGTQFQITSVLPFRGGYSVRGLVGANNVGTPNTKFDLSTDAVTLMNPTTGESITRTNTGTITNDTTVSNASANGRDQAGAFSASTWIHFYLVWDGATLKSRSSVNAPPTGPTLAAGETHWAYATSVYYDASSHLLLCRALGNKVWYEIDDGSASIRILSAGVATTFTDVSLSSVVPPNAMSVVLNCQFSLTHNVAGTQFTASIRSGAALVNGGHLAANATSAVAGQVTNSINALEFPVASAKFSYKMSSAPSGAGGFYVDVQGYSVPNGG